MPNGRTTNADLQRQISELKCIVVETNKVVNSINANLCGITVRCEDQDKRMSRSEMWQGKHDDSHRSYSLAILGAFVSALLALAGMVYGLLRPK